MKTHHAPLVVSHHGVVAARHPSELGHLKGHVQAVGKRVLAVGRVDDHLHLPEDAQTQESLSGLVGRLHHLHSRRQLQLRPLQQLQPLQGCSRSDRNVRQSGSWPGIFRRFPESADRPWSCRGHPRAPAELPPAQIKASKVLESVYWLVTSQTVASRPCSPGPPAELHHQLPEPQCRRLGPRDLAPAWAEGPGSATHREARYRGRKTRNTHPFPFRWKSAIRNELTQSLAKLASMTRPTCKLTAITITHQLWLTVACFIWAKFSFK